MILSEVELDRVIMIVDSKAEDKNGVLILATTQYTNKWNKVVYVSWDIIERFNCECSISYKYK